MTTTGGVRIRHHTRRNQILPVPLLHKPFPLVQPAYPECGKCHVWHPCKTLHLNLDDTGAVIVSHEIWADLQRVPNHAGFRVTNHVVDPPDQTIAPPTIKLRIRGVDLAGTIAEQPGRPETFTAAGRRSSTRDAQPELRTVDVNEYVDVANRNGVTIEQALNLLLVKVLSEGVDTKGQ